MPRNSYPTSSLLRRAGISFLMGFGLFVLGAVVERFLQSQRVTGVGALLDNLAMAVVAGLVVFAYEQHRYKALCEKVRVIGAMNHHVRNALQTLVYAPFHPEEEEKMRIMRQSVDRIQWALREVLPGESEELPLQGPRSKA